MMICLGASHEIRVCSNPGASSKSEAGTKSEFSACVSSKADVSLLPFFTTPVTSRKAFDTDTKDGVQEYPAGSLRIVSHIKVSCYVFVEDRDILFKYQVNLKVALMPTQF